MKHKKVGISSLLTLSFVVFLIALSFNSAAAQTITPIGHIITHTTTGLVNDLEPEPGQHWAVNDGVGLFSFFVSTTGDILYKSGYVYPPTPYNLPNNTFLLHQQININLNRGFFTLTQGVLYTPNPELPQVFLFDAVWSCAVNRLCIAELTDPYLTKTDSAGNSVHYFIPSVIFNSTANYFIYGAATDGNPDNIQAINLPNGDALIGDSEYVSSLYVPTLYYFSRGTQPCQVGDTSCLPKLTKIYSWAGTTNVFTGMSPEYLAGNAYYAVGSNSYTQYGKGNVTVYKGTAGSSWQPQSTVGTFPTANKFVISADGSDIYIAGENNATFWIQNINSDSSLGVIFSVSQTGAFDVNTTMPVGGAMKRDIYMSTHTYDSGVHFYFDYIRVGSPNTWVGLIFSTDGGQTYSVTVAAGGDTVYSKLIPPALTGMARTPFAYNPELDYLITVGRDNGLNGLNVSGFNVYTAMISIQLPVVIQMVTVSTSTNLRYALQITGTTTVTSVGPETFLNNIYTPIIMLLIVAVPAAAFSMIGSMFLAGRSGIMFLLIGVGGGLLFGVIMGIYPMYTLIIMILALVAAWRYR